MFFFILTKKTCLTAQSVFRAIAVFPLLLLLFLFFVFIDPLFDLCVQFWCFKCHLGSFIKVMPCYAQQWSIHTYGGEHSNVCEQMNACNAYSIHTKQQSKESFRFAKFSETLNVPDNDRCAPEVEQSYSSLFE